jgi:hypothetical protein
MIILQFDSRYHRWASLLLRSLELHEGNQRVLCDAVGLDSEQVRELERAHPRVACRNTLVSAEVTPAGMANRKPYVLRDAMDSYPDDPWFCLLDADMLVRRPLDDLWGLVECASAALVFTNGMWERRFYARLVTVSSVVLVRRDGRELVDRWAHWTEYDGPIGEVAPHGWFWDQVTLYLAWSESRLPIAAVPLPVFADNRFDRCAAIWAANVPDKDGYYRKFQSEHRRQRLQMKQHRTIVRGVGPRE